MITVIAEKPSVAQEIAKILKANKRQDGYISNKDYSITWAYGHLITLSMPDKYGYEKWEMNNLPILPGKFKLEPINNKGVKKQLNIIEKLFKNSNEIIVATDAGREGELIYRLIARYLKISNKNIKRLWISDLTRESIEKGLMNLKDIKVYNNLYYSAMSRACADWIVGINFTQCITLSSNKKNAISIGRVQTPTLKIITDRFKTSTNFKSKTYYTPVVKIEKDNYTIDLFSEKRYNDKNILLKEISTIMEKKEYLEIIKDNSNNNPPNLYDLTSLQKEAFNIYKFTAQETLDIAQRLYENKKITYPRTDSKHLAKSQIQEIKSLLNFLSESYALNELNEFIDHENINKSKNFNDKLITDHHAIIPTKYIETFENDNNKKIYNLIIKRTIESFSKVAIFENLELRITKNHNIFNKKFNNAKFKGWLKIKEHFSAEMKLKEVTEEQDNFKYYKGLVPGECIIKRITSKEGKTKAPALFNESSILTAMENSDKFMGENNETDNILKDKGLGTPATRASIIETLIKREFICRKKNNLIPTSFGIELINSLGDSKIVSAEYTGEMEYKLREIENGRQSLTDFMHETKVFVQEELKSIREAGKQLKLIKTDKEVEADFSYGSCPKCNNGKMKKSKKGAYCSNFKNENNKCEFFIFKNIASKNLTNKQLKDLVNKGETSLIKGFKSKSNRSFSARIILNKDYKTGFKFE